MKLLTVVFSATFNYGKSTTQDYCMDDGYPFESVTQICSKWHEHKDFAGYLLEPVMTVFV